VFNSRVSALHLRSTTIVTRLTEDDDVIKLLLRRVPRPGLALGPAPARAGPDHSVSKVSVTLLLYLQTRYEFVCCVCFYQSALCRLCVFVLCALSRVFAKGNIRYPIWTCRVPISLILWTRFSILGTQIRYLKRLNKTLDLVFVTKP